MCFWQGVIVRRSGARGLNRVDLIRWRGAGIIHSGVVA